MSIERDIDIIFVQSFLKKIPIYLGKDLKQLKIANKLTYLGKKVIVIGKN